MSSQAMRWNPEQNFEDDKNQIHLQCRKNIKLIDDVLKERLQSVSLVMTKLSTSLHDTTTENLNKGFKVAAESLETVADSSERILRKIDAILDILSDDTQSILLVVATSMLLIELISGVLLKLRINKLIKEMRTEVRNNTQEIKDLFSERWDRAEALFTNQSRNINIPRAKEPQHTSEGVTIMLNGTSHNTYNLYGRRIGLAP